MKEKGVKNSSFQKTDILTPTYLCREMPNLQFVPYPFEERSCNKICSNQIKPWFRKKKYFRQRVMDSTCTIHKCTKFRLNFFSISGLTKACTP